MNLNSEVAVCILGTLAAILLRCCVSLHSYSGQGKPPMYGDYEAQRHWMEVTYNLPITEWYHNTSDNDLQYWGLDYPPLTAYHSYLCGVIAYHLNPSFVTLYTSRGYESEEHKFYMRYTVIIADLLLYIPSIFLYFVLTRNIYRSREDESTKFGFNWDDRSHGSGNRNRLGVNTDHNKKKKNKANRQLQKDTRNGQIGVGASVVMALLYPGIILIDHGHFQYNCVSLAFAALATASVCIDKTVIGSIFFCLALNYKQMELYHALPFFLYLLSGCIPKPGQTACNGLTKLLKLAATVVVTFAVIWSPFLLDFDNFLQVIRRLFPVGRGPFEDKVSNLWCTLNVIYKFKYNFTNDQMFKYCTVATVAAVTPSATDLFLRPNRRKFVLALINSSLSFFLFSYQVHEKSILIASLPVLLYLPNDPLTCFWFLIVSTFSMLPLMIKDDLVIAFVGTIGFYSTSFYMYTSGNANGGANLLSSYYTQLIKLLKETNDGRTNGVEDVASLIVAHLRDNRTTLKMIAVRTIFATSILGCLALTFVSVTFVPPQRYPDLFPVLISIYSFVHFLVFFIYFNVEQFKVPQCFDSVKIKTA